MASELRERTQEAVDTLRGLVDGCAIAMLIDRETGLVLCKSAASVVAQDRLDRLAMAARDELDGPILRGLTKDSEVSDLITSIRIEKETFGVVIADRESAEDALVCVFDSFPDRADLSDAAEAVFAVTVEAEAA